MEVLELRALLSADSLIDFDREIGHEVANAHDERLDHDEIRYSKSGLAYYVDDFWSAEEALAVSPAEESPGAHEGAVPEGAPVTEVPAYHSNPNAPHIFYLDFTGDIVADSDWNEDFDGRPIHALPFDKDGDTTTYSSRELDMIHEVWQRVSEDYLPFNIDVTTEDPRPLPLGFRMARIIVTHNSDAESMGGTGEVWFPDAGGVAFVGSYVTSPENPGWVFHNAVPNTAKGIAEAAAHELGHIVGLSHHGDSDSEYYGGHGEGETSWAPIMGAGYRSAVTQWSDGSYADASNTRQRDLAVITNRHNGIRFRLDDHANGDDGATTLEIGVDGVLRANGIIETRRDYDTFRFEHPGGPVHIQVEPFEVGGNLDVAVVLYSLDQDVGDYVPEDTVSVEIREELEPGTYFIDVEGIGHIPAEGPGYSDYGSLGAYTVELRWDGLLSAHAGGPYEIDEGASLTLDGRRSFGFDDATMFDWDLDGDGEYDDASGQVVELTWQQLGELPVPIVDQTVFEVGLSIQRETSRDSAHAMVTIHNVAPRVTTKPQEGFVDTLMLVQIEAEDIPADRMLFEWDFGDGAKRQIVTSTTVLHTYREAGEYTVRVNAGDDEGAVTTATFQVTILADRPGDINRDGIVDFDDFLVLATNFGQQDAAWDQGDFDEDGDVSFSDFLVLSANFTS